MLSCKNVELPSDIIITRILPLLDRCSFDRFSSTSKTLHEATSQILPPWPDRLVAQDHLCRMKSFAFSSRGMLVASGCSDGRVRLWHLQTGEQKPLEGHWPDEDVHCVVFARQSEGLLASACKDHTILIWNLVETTRQHGFITTKKLSVHDEPLKIHSSNVSCLRFSPDDSMVIAGYQSSETIKFWNISTGALTRTLSGPLSRISTMEISQNGQTLIAAAYGDDSSSNSLRVWNLEDGTSLAKPGGFHNVVAESKDPSCGGFLVASLHQPESFIVWSATSTNNKRRKTDDGARGRRFMNAYPHEIAFSPDGSQVASVDDFRSIKVWSVQDGTLLSTFHDDSAISLHAISICPSSTRTVGAISRTRIGAISQKQNLLRLFHLNHSCD